MIQSPHAGGWYTVELPHGGRRLGTRGPPRTRGGEPEELDRLGKMSLGSPPVRG